MVKTILQNWHIDQEDSKGIEWNEEAFINILFQ
jgi:hypothetical protein